MEKMEGKTEVADSTVPLVVETVSGNDMIAESAPSGSMVIQEAPTLMVVDKSEEVETKEEARNGPDESEEVAEPQKSEDGRDEAEEVEEIEESKDGLDDSEGGDKISETIDTLEKSVAGDKEEETEKEGKVERMADDVPDREEEESVPDEKVEKQKLTGEVEYRGNGESTSGKKARKTRKRKKAAASAAAPSDANKVSDGKVEPVADDVPDREDEERVPDEQVEERNLTRELANHAKGESTSGKKAKRTRKSFWKRKKTAHSAAAPGTANKSSNGKVESVADVVPDRKDNERVTGEKDEERDLTGKVLDHGKGESSSGKKARRMRKRKKSAASTAAPNDANKSSDSNKQGTSAAVKKDLKMADGMGLIFMCNSKTKLDCFRYNVFGLPASKKEIVAKVYKGMKLFLFDVSLRLMFGIYKAASPGGYNIEPNAFKSAFPSQVRFTRFKDCLPLPEEKFKAAIKENYHGSNQFNCQLSPEQVKNLCKLFKHADKASRKKRSSKVIRAQPDQISSFQSQSSHRGRARGDDSIPRSRDLYRRREAYASPPPRSLALPPPAPAHYAYAQPMDDYYYRRDPPLVEPRDHRIVHIERRSREHLAYHDPYSEYREPLPREVVYVEPLPSEAIYREPLPRVAAYGEREALYREPLPREVFYREPLSREAVYGEPVHTLAVNPPSFTPAAYAASSTYYRY